MNHKEKLLEIYKLSYSVTDIEVVSNSTKAYIELIGQKINTQKGVFTALVTLLTHKILQPKQDIRKHQSGMAGGFSGRTIDTQYITPTLKELGLPSMAESGWLTRSLEQPYPYNLDYNGKISDKKVKEAFLNILDYVEKNATKATDILRLLLFEAIQLKIASVVQITPLDEPEKLSIEKIVEALHLHFKTKYGTHGGSKLPVLAFYAIYQHLVKEIGRYQNCTLANLGSHTASDRTSKTAGDIQVFKGEKLFETVEIKLDKVIDATMTRVAIEKIERYNPTRYYILSHIGIDDKQQAEIDRLVNDLRENHGCQLIINGLLPTIKYYLRLISSIESFVNVYGKLVEVDTELQTIHKERWNEIVKSKLNG